VAPTRAAILMAPGTTSTPGWTVTLDHEGNLLMQPLVHTQVDPGSQVLLWTRRETIPEPRLLGRIDPNRPVQVPASQLGIVADDQLFEITLETDEDARNGVAHGPILYIGQMTIFGSENALPGSVSQMSSTPPDSASEPESALK
jgi:anti-sigma-K factor RskA